MHSPDDRCVLSLVHDAVEIVHELANAIDTASRLERGIFDAEFRRYHRGGHQQRSLVLAVGMPAMPLLQVVLQFAVAYDAVAIDVHVVEYGPKVEIALCLRARHAAIAISIERLEQCAIACG